MRIYFMQPEHERGIRRLVMRYLKETYETGGDFPPTLENSAAFTRHGIEGAAIGDPCLIAMGEDADADKIVAFMMGRGLHFPGMTTRYKTIRTWGTYVMPAYRKKHYAAGLILIFGRVAKQAGYERYLAMTHGTGYGENAKKVAGLYPGMHVIGSVIAGDLSRKVKKEPTTHDADPVVSSARTANVEAAAPPQPRLTAERGVQIVRLDASNGGPAV